MKTVKRVSAVPNLLGHRIDLTWQNPLASDFGSGAGFAGLRIVRRRRTFPLAIDDGTVVYPLGYQPLGPQFGPVVSRFSDPGLEALENYYYTIFTTDGTNQFFADDDSRAYAAAADDFVINGRNLVERLYQSLPAVHQRFDRLTATELAQLPPAAVAALERLPAPIRGRGPLRRFLHAAGSSLNAMRSSAEMLPDLYDADWAPSDFLLPLAQWLGWELDRTLPVYAQRNEVKFAPRRYQSVGTVANLRDIVNRYTRLYSQVAEFGQHIARSNMPPQYNLFSIVEGAGGAWIGADDATAVFDLTTPEIGVFGTATTAASVTSVNAEPFALRPGLEMAVTADNRIPAAVRFEIGDFANPGAATAAEVCDVVNRTMSEITAVPVGGRIRLSSNTVGENSSLRIERYLASLISLESAPRGRLSGLTDRTIPASTRLRLFYETADPLAVADERAARATMRGEKSAHGFLAQEPEAGAAPPGDEAEGERWTAATPQSRIRYKTFRQGNGADPSPSRPIPGPPTRRRRSPPSRWQTGAAGFFWLRSPNRNPKRHRPPRSRSVSGRETTARPAATPASFRRPRLSRARPDRLI
jgi:phage tail-like protein